VALLGFFLNKGSSLRSLEHSLNHDYPILLQITREVPEHLAQVGAEYQVQAEGWLLSGRYVCRCESFPEPSEGALCCQTRLTLVNDVHRAVLHPDRIDTGIQMGHVERAGVTESDEIS
jgi:hypothetical protein